MMKKAIELRRGNAVRDGAPTLQKRTGLSLTLNGGVIRCELSRGTDATPLGLMNL